MERGEATGEARSFYRRGLAHGGHGAGRRGWGGSGASVVPRACRGCVRAAWRELGEGGRFARALWCFGRRRPPRARGWGVRTAGLPRLRGSVAGGEARGGEGERGGTRCWAASAMPRRSTCRPRRASSGARSPATLLLNPGRFDDAEVRIAVREAMVIDRNQFPAGLHTISSNLVRILWI